MYKYGGIYDRQMCFNSGPKFSMEYWTRSLYQRLTALINIKGLPKGSENQYAWDIDALKYALFFIGYMGVFESKRYGVVPQPGTIAGFGLQYQPTGFLVNTPYFQFGRPLRIGVECELIKLTPDYTGVFDIITKYAAELKEIDTSIKAAARGSRFAYALIADSDKSARTMKAIREKIINGDDVRSSEETKLTPTSFPGISSTGISNRIISWASCSMPGAARLLISTARSACVCSTIKKSA